MKRVYWIVWGVLTLLIAGYFLNMMFYAEDKSELIIGEATHGHYQIEMACTSCHTESFGGEDMLQNACVDCHGDQLKVARDSHPKKKFTDPRNADLVDILDARYCVSCHTEHQNEQTHAMGLTVPGDYCFHCHETNLFTNFGFQNNGLDSVYSNLGLENVTGNIADRGKFKIQTLRNIEVTAPYMFDGRYNTLDEVIEFYQDHVVLSDNVDVNIVEMTQDTLVLTAQDKQDLKAFLLTLTDQEFLSNPDFASPF